MSEVQTGTITTKVPARLDRLPWSRWHWMVIIGLVTAYLFGQHLLTAVTLMACWSVVLLVASAATSGAHLTVSEVFPMETRALAIAFFYAIGTGLGGITGPLLFAKLVGTGKVPDTVTVFCIGASLMILAGITEVIFGVKGELQSLENIATPLTAQDSDSVRGGAAPAAT